MVRHVELRQKKNKKKILKRENSLKHKSTAPDFFVLINFYIRQYNLGNDIMFYHLSFLIKNNKSQKTLKKSQKDFQRHAFDIKMKQCCRKIALLKPTFVSKRIFPNICTFKHLKPRSVFYIAFTYIIEI